MRLKGLFFLEKHGEFPLLEATYVRPNKDYLIKGDQPEKGHVREVT